LYIHPGPATGPGAEFVLACAELALQRGWKLAASPGEARLALAPSLRRVLGGAERRAPVLGTLVCHPSPLPARRGPDAVKWAFYEGDRVVGSTWFWADQGLDTGPICAQSLASLVPGLASPLDLYQTQLIPLALDALDAALERCERNDGPAGDPQPLEGATYQSWHPTTLAAKAARQGAKAPD
jgi:formyltetrahydrofolate dehydrogenase